jgi:D-arabinose 1-dehydrogenase-like Zn-dependent alcohol dehydrogenase
MKKFVNFSHPFYKSVSSSAAQAVGWAFTTPKEINPIAFNFESLKKDEVRVKVQYCGLCHSDVLMARDKWFHNLTYPILPGHEVVAEVSHVGTDVKDMKIGDKVGFGFLRDCCGACKYCKMGKENLCTDPNVDRAVFGQHFGGFATSLQQPAKFFFKLPENLDMARSGPLLCAGITVFSPIKHHIRKGDRAAVIGIGGLGHMAVQFLAKKGHEVTAFNNHLDYKDLIHKLGANEVVDVTNFEELQKHYNRYDFIINTVPYGRVTEKLINLCAPQGRFVQVGLPEEADPLIVPHIPLIFKEVQLIGSIVGNIEDNKDMLKFAAENQIYPICEEYKFEDFEKAVEKIEKGKPKFRVVINISDWAKKNNFH